MIFIRNFFNIYIQKSLHRGIFTDRHFYSKKSLDQGLFTDKHMYIGKIYLFLSLYIYIYIYIDKTNYIKKSLFRGTF